MGYSGETEIVGEEGLVAIDRKRMYPGYTLFGIQSLCMAKLVDEDGKVMKTWRDPDAQTWENV